MSAGNSLTHFDYFYYGGKTKFSKPEDVSRTVFLMAIEEGSFQYHIEEIYGTASFGDLILLVPGMHFERVALNTMKLHVFHFQFCEAEQQQQNNLLQGCPFGKISLRNTSRLSTTYSLLHSLQHVQGEIKARTARHALCDLLLLIQIEQELKRHHHLIEDPFVGRALDMMHRQAFSPDFQLQQAAAQLGLSHANFSLKFQKEMGRAPIEYITSLRLQKARALLVETNLTMEEIAGRCGYQNGFYFSRVFSRHMAMTPSQFRKKHRL